MRSFRWNAPAPLTSKRAFQLGGGLACSAFARPLVSTACPRWRFIATIASWKTPARIRTYCAALRQLTGGRFNPHPSEVFEAGGRTVNSSIDLWPALLLAAILLNLVELAARKGWPGRFRRWA